MSKTKISELCTIKYGKDHKQLDAGTIPVYGSGGVMRYADKALHDKASVLIPRKGTLGNLFYVDKPFWTVDTLFWTDIDITKVIPRYLYYALKTKNLASLNVGTAVPSLTTAVLNDVEINLPSLREQQRVVDILASLDDKIELNRKMNENLEQQAAALFKHWFIDFEFPDAKGKPYRSSGGKMKDSPLGLIPDEWGVGSLEDLSQTNVAGLSNSDDYDFINYLDTGSITDNHISSYQKLLKGVDKFPSRAKRKVRKNNIVYSLVRPNQRHFGIITEPEDNMIASTGFAVIEAKCHCAHFIYFYLIREECIKHLQALAEQSVSTYPTLRSSDIENLQVVLPPQALLIQFENMAASLVRKISKNHIENRLLSKKRDNFIPELMNK